MRIATPIYTISSTTSTIYGTNVNGTVVQVQEVQSSTMHHSSTTSTIWSANGDISTSTQPSTSVRVIVVCSTGVLVVLRARSLAVPHPRSC